MSIPKVIRDNTTFVAEYEHLQAGDIVVGRLKIKPGEEHILLDLETRGVVLIPSGLSQLCSRSKVFQARILSRFMIPGTTVLYNRHDILTLTSEWGKRRFGKVICKLDRANGGMGILLFHSIEDVYNQAVLGSLEFPFVIQPFLENCKDVRAIFFQEFVEAYSRYNPDSFRHNLHCGGESAPFELNGEQIDLCRKVMNRCRFEYGHVDLLIDMEGRAWLSEINLRGGLSGSSLSQQDYLDNVKRIHADMLAGYGT